MADKKLSQLPTDPTPVAATDLVYLARDTGGGTYSSVKATVSAVRAGPIANHVAIGNVAEIDQITFAPGDPTFELTYQVPIALAVNESVIGDLSQDFIESISNYPGYAHTGTQPATILGVDTEVAILTQSTGPIAYLAGTESDIYFYGSSSLLDGECSTTVFNHFGSGAIDFAAGVVGQVHHRTTTGTMNTGYGVWAAVAADVGTAGADTLVAGHFEYNTGWTVGTIQNVIGVEIADCSGKGVTLSHNLVSRGANSINLLEGNLDINGHAAFGNFGAVDVATWRPGDPGAPFNAVALTNSPLLLNEYYTGDLDAIFPGAPSPLLIYPGYKHTGANPLHRIFGIDCEPSINSDNTQNIFVFVAGGFFPYHYGNSHIGFFNAIDAEPFVGHPAGATVDSVAAVYGAANFDAAYAGHCINYEAIQGQLYIPDHGTIGLATTLHALAPIRNAISPPVVPSQIIGLWIEDHHGFGSALELNLYSAGVQTGNKFDGYIHSVPRTFANRPTTPAQGMICEFSDSTVNTFGATIAGGGANKVLGHYNGTNWTVMAV